MIKLVYVMVGVEKTEYQNMLRISLASARKWMPDIEIVIVADDETASSLKSGDLPKKYSVDITSVTVEGDYTTVEKSRYIKTQLREFVTGDFLFLDTDTIICADISDAAPEGSVNMALDAHCLFEEQGENAKLIRSKAQKKGISLDGCVKYYNSGVILAKDDDDAHLFFRKWFESWDKTRLPGLHQDQHSLNAVAMQTGLVHELDGTWNCQLTANDRAFSYLRNVRILHYLSLQPEGIYRLNRREELNSLTDEKIEQIINAPEKQFIRFYYYAEDSTENRIMEQSLYRLVYRMYTRRPKLYHRLEKMFSKLRK